MNFYLIFRLARVVRLFEIYLSEKPRELARQNYRLLCPMLYERQCELCDSYRGISRLWLEQLEQFYQLSCGSETR